MGPCSSSSASNALVGNVVSLSDKGTSLFPLRLAEPDPRAVTLPPAHATLKPSISICHCLWTTSCPA